MKKKKVAGGNIVARKRKKAGDTFFLEKLQQPKKGMTEEAIAEARKALQEGNYYPAIDLGWPSTAESERYITMYGQPEEAAEELGWQPLEAFDAWVKEQQ